METQSALEWQDRTGGGQVYPEDSLGEGREKFEGNEHRIFQSEDGRRAIKLTRPPNFGARGSLADYLDNLVLNNFLWGDDLRVEGIVETPAGLQLIVSQPWIFNEPWLDEAGAYSEIHRFLTGLGFREVRLHTFQRDAADQSPTMLMDARPANILKDAESGLLIPIDVHIAAPECELKLAWDEQRRREAG